MFTADDLMAAIQKNLPSEVECFEPVLVDPSDEGVVRLTDKGAKIFKMQFNAPNVHKYINVIVEGELLLDKMLLENFGFDAAQQIKAGLPCSEEQTSSS